MYESNLFEEIQHSYEESGGKGQDFGLAAFWFPIVVQVVLTNHVGAVFGLHVAGDYLAFHWLVSLNRVFGLCFSSELVYFML